MGGTRRTEGAVESQVDKALAGGEAEGSLTAHCPDRDELGHGSCQELRICSCRHIHLYGSIGTSLVQDDLVSLKTLEIFQDKRYIMEIAVITQKVPVGIVISSFQFTVLSSF